MSDPCPEMMAAFEAEYGQRWNGARSKLISHVWERAWFAARAQSQSAAGPELAPSVKNPFRKLQRRMQFENLVSSYYGRNLCFFTADGTVSRHGNLAEAFWAGHDGTPFACRWEDVVFVAYRAGVAIKELKRIKA